MRPSSSAEQRALTALVRRVLARQQPDVRRGAREPLALVAIELGEDRDPADLLGRHHGGNGTAWPR